jgi:Ribbon-helix-helix domain
MSQKITVVVDDETYDFLKAESERTSVPMSELVRRALDVVFKLKGRRTTGLEIRFGVWRRRIFGRRAGVAFDPRPPYVLYD